MTIKGKRNVVLGWNPAQNGNSLVRSGGEAFAFAKSWLVAARQIGMSLLGSSALASRGGALAGHDFSVPQIA